MSGLSSVWASKGPSARFLLLGSLLAPPFRGPMLVAGAAFALSSTLDIHPYLPLLCGSAEDHLPVVAILASVRFLLAINPPGSLALAWLAMLLAMMTPLIALPLSHVRASSLVARRWRAAAGFVLGYFGVWMCAGVPLLAAAFALRLLAGSVPAAFLATSLLALVWSANPLQKAAQNRAHRLRRIGLFGLAADRDCMIFGAALGGWCLASCWAWMLVPLFAPAAHVPAMVAVASILMAERLRGPGPARWRVPVVLSLPLGWLRGLSTQGRRQGARALV
jgi:predicted metal-binding membrane protein